MAVPRMGTGIGRHDEGKKRAQRADNDKDIGRTIPNRVVIFLISGRARTGGAWKRTAAPPARKE